MMRHKEPFTFPQKIKIDKLTRDELAKKAKSS